MRTRPEVDDDDISPSSKKGSRTGLARRFSRAYLSRTDRRGEEGESSPIMSRAALTGDGILHLRKGEGGKGTLLVNGSMVSHLNPMAYEMLSMFFSDMETDAVIKEITRGYKVKSDIAREDYRNLVKDIERLEKGGMPRRGNRVDPLSGPYNSPLRLDMAITYRGSVVPGPGDRADGSQGVPSGDGEMEVDQWLQALDRAWEAGIPHICITGGEPTEKEGLVEIVNHASSLGMMVGLLTDGEALARSSTFDRLASPGISYMQVDIASHDEEVHARILNGARLGLTLKAMEKAMDRGLPILCNLVITKESEYGLEDTVEFVAEMGVEHLTVHQLDRGEETMPDWMMEKALLRARTAARGRLRIFWFGPVRGGDPRRRGEDQVVGDLALGHLDWGAARTNIYIHPDGTVTPARRHGRALGNVRQHDWSMLWYHTALRDIRRKHLEKRRWRTLSEMGFTGYPLYPGLDVRGYGEGDLD